MKQASFLDARIFTRGQANRTLPWPEVESAIKASQLAEGCGFIFHIGHVGSTLLSRLVGAHRGAFSLREPAILRTFAQLKVSPKPTRYVRRCGDLDERLSGCLNSCPAPLMPTDSLDQGHQFRVRDRGRLYVAPFAMPRP